LKKSADKFIANPGDDNEQILYHLASCYHQIECGEEALEYYRLFTKNFKKPLDVLPNLSELLVHSFKKFDEAEENYILCSKRMYSETVDVALASLHLLQEKPNALEEMEKLLNHKFIKTCKNSWLEGTICYYIHSFDKKKN